MSVLVVGGGVVGLAVAWRLLDRGAEVLLAEQRPGGPTPSASAASGAMLSIFSEIDGQQTDQRVAADVAERVAADRRWLDWLDRLPGPVHVSAGTWVVGSVEEQALLDRMRRAALDHGYAAELYPVAAVPVRPSTGRVAAGLWLPGERAVDAQQLLAALRAAVRQHPRARPLDQPVTRVQLPDSGPLTAVLADGRQVAAEAVVIAAGAGTERLLGADHAALGLPPIFAGRGTGLLVDDLDDGREHTVRSPNRAFACGTHLVPRAEGRLYLGATNRFAPPDDPMTDGAALDEVAVLIHAAVTEIDDRLYSARLVSAHTGYRPFTLDRWPLVGRTAHPRLLLATATYRSGVMLAPRIAEQVAAEILDSHPPVSPYRPDRPMALPASADTVSDAARGLLGAVMEPGGWLPPGVEPRVTALLTLALRTMLADGADGAVVARLRESWAAAPVSEALPALLREVYRAQEGGRHG